jgi:hypothetical protein
VKVKPKTNLQKMRAAAESIAEQWEGEYDGLMGAIRQARAARVPGLRQDAFLLPGTKAIGHSSDIDAEQVDGTRTNPMPSGPLEPLVTTGDDRAASGVPHNDRGALEGPQAADVQWPSVSGQGEKGKAKGKGN